MFEAIIDSLVIELEKHNSGYSHRGEELHPEITQINDKLWQIHLNGREYKVFIHKSDPENREVFLSINGKRKTVKLRSRAEKLLDALGMSEVLKPKLDSLKAPMPGLIHSVLTEPGATVEKGAPLFILEAMKMENIIKSPGEGVIEKIHVAQHDSVEKNALLITFR